MSFCEVFVSLFRLSVSLSCLFFSFFSLFVSLPLSLCLCLPLFFLPFSPLLSLPRLFLPLPSRRPVRTPTKEGPLFLTGENPTYPDIKPRAWYFRPCLPGPAGDCPLLSARVGGRRGPRPCRRREASGLARPRPLVYQKLKRSVKHLLNYLIQGRARRSRVSAASLVPPSQWARRRGRHAWGGEPGAGRGLRGPAGGLCEYLGLLRRDRGGRRETKRRDPDRGDPGKPDPRRRGPDSGGLDAAGAPRVDSSAQPRLLFAPVNRRADQFRPINKRRGRTGEGREGGERRGREGEDGK